MISEVGFREEKTIPGRWGRRARHGPGRSTAPCKGRTEKNMPTYPVFPKKSLDTKSSFPRPNLLPYTPDYPECVDGTQNYVSSVLSSAYTPLMNLHLPTLKSVFGYLNRQFCNSPALGLY